ncbi:MAG: ribosome maturation factor RimP [Bdellovibrionales bacterium]|nr:ribosome maturation factor RimP [Bdellovibrionales bacterium]
MLTSGQLERIRLFAEEVASREGCVLYDLEFREGPGRTLRVFIDKEPGGVSIDDCANVSRGLNLRLDVEDAMPGGAYDLEVSSPGLDRKLTQLWHYQKAAGQIVQLKYKDDTGASRPYEGKLVSVDGERLSLENSKGPFAVEFSAIEKGRIVIGDVLQKKPAPGKKKKR